MSPIRPPRCYFAYRSPYSRLGLHKLARAGVELELIPFTGPPEGVAFANPTDNPLKSTYYAQDVFRLCVRMGLPVTLPKPFDADFAPANRAFIAADREGFGMGFALAASDARWGEGRDLSDPAVLGACAAAAGWNGYDAAAIAADASISETLRAQRARIAEDGVFGVPFLVDGDQKYWGQDRFDLWLETRASGT